jgi:hypothetical protein
MLKKFLLHACLAAVWRSAQLEKWLLSPFANKGSELIKVRPGQFIIKDLLGVVTKQATVLTDRSEVCVSFTHIFVN